MSHTDMTSDPRRSAAPGARLGPGSMLWRIAGDWRSGLSGLSAGILQLMDPHLGKGVEEHSAFFREPFDRIFRSVPQIWATILADDAEDRGRTIRDHHTDIAGTDDHGNRYHALHPDTFWWAHATFTWEMFQTIDRWDGGRLSRSQRERLYQETVTWYRRYGVSDRPVPVDHRAFEARWRERCLSRLEMTPTASRAIDMALEGDGELPGVPDAVTRMVAPAVRTIAIGCLPNSVRTRFDIPWSHADEARLAAITIAVRGAGAVVPHRLVRTPYLHRIRKMRSVAAPRPAA